MLMPSTGTRAPYLETGHAGECKRAQVEPNHHCLDLLRWRISINHCLVWRVQPEGNQGDFAKRNNAGDKSLHLGRASDMIEQDVSAGM